METHNTPLSLAGAEERQIAIHWLDSRIREKGFDLAYNVLELVECVRNNTIYDIVDVSELQELDCFGMMEALANEILIIRDLEREGE